MSGSDDARCSSQSARLLILGCSQRKVQNPGLLPAVERYDGPAFRVLRRYLRQTALAGPNVLILSAEFGVVHGEQQIAAYDRRLSPARAISMRDDILRSLRRVFESAVFQDVFISLGRDYLAAITGFSEFAPPGCRVCVAEGGLGSRISHLRQWLWEPAGISATDGIRDAQTGRPVRIAGLTLTPTREEAVCILSEALQELQTTEEVLGWHTVVDGQKVAVKRAISQIFGVPVSRFHTDAARRILRQLGLPVYSE